MAGVGQINVELGWPDKRLSPNAREHFMQVSIAKKAARHEAGWAATIALGRDDFEPPAGKIPVHLIAHPHKTGPLPDEDNLVASLKAHFDAIAKAIGVNDRDFKQTGVTFAERREKALVIVQIGGAQ